MAHLGSIWYVRLFNTCLKMGKGNVGLAKCWEDMPYFHALKTYSHFLQPHNVTGRRHERKTEEWMEAEMSGNNRNEDTGRAQ